MRISKKACSIEFEKNIFEMKGQIVSNITCNTICVSSIPNCPVTLLFTSVFVPELSSFDSIIPKIADLK